MGGDGPHGGKRNSSFALATLRPHGFAAVRGTGTLLTAPLNVSAPMLTVSADVEAGGSVRIGERVWSHLCSHPLLTPLFTPSIHTRCASASAPRPMRRSGCCPTSRCR